MKNKFDSKCCKCRAHVLKSQGYIIPATKGLGWDVWCAECYKSSDDSFVKIMGKNRGRTWSLSVRDTWRRIFEENEERFERDDASALPWTDNDIREFMIEEFPDASKESRSVKRIRMYRGTWNAGSHSFMKIGDSREASGEGREADPQSHEYDENGKRVGDGGRRVVRVGVSEARVKEIVRDELHDRPVVHVHFPEGTTTKVDMRGKHVKLPDVLSRVAAGLPVLMVGPTGSGKTYLASQVAEALDSNFTFNSMSEGISESHLFGRVLPGDDGAWTYRPSPFVHTWTNGGVHLLDEIDGADANLLVALNAALANGLLSLPFAGIEPIVRHKDCVIVSAANTFGMGADRQYVGRNQLDAATLDRFKMGTVEIDYDSELERAIVQGIMGKRKSDAGRLLLWGWKTRHKIREARLLRNMTTRNFKDMAQLMVAGKTMDECRHIYYLGWSKDELAKVEGVKS